MKVSELIEELQKKLNDFGDVDVKFGEYSGNVNTSVYHELEDVTVEEFDRDVIVIWDK